MTHLQQTVHRPALRMAGLPRLLRQMAALHRQRSALARMDSDGLRDIGLSPDAAQSEAARPAWDIPCAWRER